MERQGDTQRAERHRSLYQNYKLDDNLRDSAILEARKKYPAADAAAERAVQYSLQHPDAYPLPVRGNYRPMVEFVE